MTFVRVVIAAGTIALLMAFAAAGTWHTGTLVGSLALACTAGRLKFRIPGIEGTCSLLFAFVLVSIEILNPAETAIVATAGILVQCLFGTIRRPRGVQLAFNVSGHALSALTAWLLHHAINMGRPYSGSVVLPLTGTAFFLLNTSLVSGAIATTSGRRFFGVWRDCLRCLPFYAAGSALIGVALSAGNSWNRNLLLISTLPALTLLYCYQRSKEVQRSKE